MAKGHRSQIKRARNESNRETRPSAKLSYARISVQKACYVLDVFASSFSSGESSSFARMPTYSMVSSLITFAMVLFPF